MNPIEKQITRIEKTRRLYPADLEFLCEYLSRPYSAPRAQTKDKAIEKRILRVVKKGLELSSEVQAIIARAIPCRIGGSMPEYELAEIGVFEAGDKVFVLLKWKVQSRGISQHIFHTYNGRLINFEEFTRKYLTICKKNPDRK